MLDDSKTTDRGWHWELTFFKPDDSLALELQLTDEQATAIRACCKQYDLDSEDFEETCGEREVMSVFLGAWRDA